MIAINDRSIGRIKVNDALVQCMSPTLAWIPTINPASRAGARGFGLNLYGPTALENEAARKLGRIVDGWRRIFGEATETIRFPLFSVAETDEAFENLHRSTVLESLDRLSTLADRVAKDPSLWVLHLGI